jgi:hypothetical protein
VRDKKMLEKLATHDVQDISELFSLADKCARVMEGHNWHSQPTPEVGKVSKLDTDATGGKDKSLAGAPTAAVAGGGRGPCGDKRPHQSFVSDEGGQQCPVHNSKCHGAEECWEIKKLAEQVHEQQ